MVSATLRDNEYGWKLSAFPAALAAAERHELACLGGQVQFRVENSVFEAYWCNADSSERMPEEAWRVYVQRSCKEVKEKFTELSKHLNVQKLVAEWPTLSTFLTGRNPKETLFFVAYFVTEREYLALASAHCRAFNS